MTPKKSKHTPGITPAMAQYHTFKEAYPDCFLFFRMGDFYEMFYTDAVKAANILDIALTQRGKENGHHIPMCGVPVQSSEAYLHKLIKKGHRVAICEQVEDAKAREGKGPLKREVLRVVTPGTITEESLLEPGSYNFLAAVVVAPQGGYGIAYIDISTGDVFTESFAQEALSAVLLRIAPKELLLQTHDLESWEMRDIEDAWGRIIQPVQNTPLSLEAKCEALCAFYAISTLESFGVRRAEELSALYMVLKYTTETQKHACLRLLPPKRVQGDDMLYMDRFTRRSLELTVTLEGEKAGSLFEAIDQTVTSQGARLLALRLHHPLTSQLDIQKRLESVGFFVDNQILCTKVRDLLKKIPDMERALGRLSLGRETPRDLHAIKETLRNFPFIREALEAKEHPPLIADLLKDLKGHDALQEKLLRAIKNETLPVTIKEGGVLASGFCTTLDSLRTLAENGAALIHALQARYIQESEIPSLKIRHNAILGYYIEVTKAQSAKAPFTFFVRQSTVTTVRYTTQELCELEGQLAEAKKKVLEHEMQLLKNLVEEIIQTLPSLQMSARAIGALDVMASLGHLAVTCCYVKPLLEESTCLMIQKGRHPVVERRLQRHNKDPFVPNDLCLKEGEKTWVITGANMAGKSTFLRQNAIIVLMAQMGSYVPAAYAKIGIVDRLFSRVGASDDLSRGLSTFMVEMTELAAIFNQATSKSFIICDELGRGTSTQDGLALAQACIEYGSLLHDFRVLFSTHYHELVERLAHCPVGLYTFKVLSWEEDLIFLYAIEKGHSDASYGLRIAKMAGIPPWIVARATNILSEQKEGSVRDLAPISQSKGQAEKEEYVKHASKQQPSCTVCHEIQTVTVDTLSPRDALNLLYSLKAMLH